MFRFADNLSVLRTGRNLQSKYKNRHLLNMFTIRFVDNLSVPPSKKEQELNEMGRMTVFYSGNCRKFSYRDILNFVSYLLTAY